MRATHDELVACFTKWDAEYRKHPEKFDNAVQHLLRNTPNTYGARAAVCFTKFMNDVRKKR